MKFTSLFQFLQSMATIGIIDKRRVESTFVIKVQSYPKVSHFRYGSLGTIFLCLKKKLQ